mmetsp:Transcript_98004/g.272703  ORF Transcript_98004/g.272703 Transcript_98004/m.272703 type:complete len:344 (-) Transcript_98004:134-1165(-)
MEGDGDAGVTARYLLPDLPDDVTEDGIINYFSVMGEIEEVNVKVLGTGRRMGSVKFLNPTMDLRNLMLKESHEIDGSRVQVSTWKMQKLQKPAYAAKTAAEVVAKGKGASSSSGAKGSANGKGRDYTGKGSYGGMGGGAYGAWGKGSSCGWGCGSGGKGDDWWGGPSYGPAYGPSGKASGKASWGPYGPAMGKMGPGYKSPSKGCGKSDPYAWKGAFWKGAGPSTICGKGGGKTGKKGEDEMEVTSRFLLSDLPADCTQEALQEYFSGFGEIEDATCKVLVNGAGIVGSVKFRGPTMELRRQMLREPHTILGEVVKVETHKMRKNARPVASKNVANGDLPGAS